MATRRAPTKTWVARDSLVQIGKYPTVKFDSSTTLSGSFASSGYGIARAFKNITVTPPETSYEKLDLLGKDSNAFQNQILDEKPVGGATIQGTLILGEDETIEDQIISGSATAIDGTHSRYQIGNDTTSRQTVTLVVSVFDESKEVAFGIEDAKITKWGDVRLSDTGSHWEQDITVLALAKDFYYEFKD